MQMSNGLATKKSETQTALTDSMSWANGQINLFGVSYDGPEMQNSSARRLQQRVRKITPAIIGTSM